MIRQRTRRCVVSLSVAALALLGPSGAARAWCSGDCDGDAVVTVSELVTCVGQALGAGAAACPACDADGDGLIGIAELVAASAQAVNGCGAASQPTATRTPTAPDGAAAAATRTAAARHASPVLPRGCELDGGKSCTAREPRAALPCGATTLVSPQSGTTVGAADHLGGTNCDHNGGGSGAPDLVYDFVAPAAGQYRLELTATGFNPLLHIRRGDCQGAFLKCAVDPTGLGQPETTVILAAGEHIAIAVDGNGAGEQGPFALTVTPRLPDLRVSQLLVPPSATVGQPVDVQVEVQNVGDLDAGSFVTELQYFRDQALTQPMGQGPATCRIASLAAGASATCRFDVPLSAPFVAAGTYAIAASVDSQREVRERGDAANGGNGANNQASAPTEVVVPGAVLDQRVFRALDGTVYQLVRVLPSADRTAAEHYRITSLVISSGFDSICATSNAFPGGTARAFAAGGGGPSLRTAILQPGDVATSFDASGAGRLTLGAGASDVDVCAGCTSDQAATLVGLNQATGGMPAACLAQNITDYCVDGQQTTTVGFGDVLGPFPTTFTLCSSPNALTGLTEICREEPDDGFVLRPGQSVVFILRTDQFPDPHLPLKAAIGAFGVTVDEQNDSGCTSRQIVEALALQSDTGRQAVLSFVEAQNRRRFDFSSIIVSTTGANVYVSDGSGQVLRFDRNAATGSLTLAQTIKEGTGGVSGLTAAAALALSPDGRHLYVVSGCRDNCNVSDDALVVLARDISTGALSFVQTIRDTGPVDGLAGASAVAVSPDGAHVYVAGTADDAVATFARDAGTGRLTFVEALRGQTLTPNLLPEQLAAPRSIAIGGNGAQVYVACSGPSAAGPGTVVALSRAAATGRLTPAQVVSAAFRPVDVALGPGDAQLYVASGILLTPGMPNLLDGVWTYTRNAQTGMLTLLQALGDAPGEVGTVQRVRELALSPDGTNLQLLSAPVSGNTQAAKVANFTRNTQTGALTFVNNADVGLSGAYDNTAFAFGFARSPTGGHTYVTGGTATRGVVALLGGQNFVMPADGPDGLAGAAAAAFYGDGSFLVVGSKQDGAVVLFQRDPTTGHLTQRDVRRDAPVSANVAIATDPTISDIYVLAGSGIRRYQLSFATGAATLQFKDETALGSPGVDLALAFAGQRLYVITATAIKVYTRNTQTGVLSLAQTLSEKSPGVPLTSTALAAIAISHHSTAYVVHQPRHVTGTDYEMPITRLQISNGLLTFAEETSPGGVGPETTVGNSAIEIQPTDDFVYVARGSADSGVVDVYAAPSYTSLSLQATYRTGVGGVAGFKGTSALSLYARAGQFVSNPYPYLFVAGGDPAGTGASGDDAVAVFRNLGNASLSLIEQQRNGLGRVEGLDGPATVVVSPDHRHLYVVTGVDNSVVLFAINDALTN